MADSIGIVILAAGKGTRLKIDMAKALCPLQGKTLVDYVLQHIKNFEELSKANTESTLVVGHKREDVMERTAKYWPEVSFAWQKEQKGTAHALQTYFEQTAGAWEKDLTLVVCADTPLISEKEYLSLYNELKQDLSLEAVAAVFETENPTGYGRIVSGNKGFEIVEEKDASAEQKNIKQVNSGLYLFRTEHIKKRLSSIADNNKSGEFYLTDLFKKEFKVKALSFDDPVRFLGVNNLVQLEEASKVLQKEKIAGLQLEGVRFLNSSSCYIEDSVKIGLGSVIYPNVVMEGEVEVGENCVIEAGTLLRNTKVGPNSYILANSHLDGASLDASVKAGPM
ncbi:MAG: sugar phosphate nucleotidyltransferase, partial [Bacteriovoracaceae bacterium]